jgi:XTP/dITP diphosphohydrolase
MNILIATRNLHKVQEIQAILGDAHRYFTLAEFPEAPAVIEDADSFEGNAAKKAVTLARWIAQTESKVDYVLADDSGLEVDALDGAPGVHSARFARLESGSGGNSPDRENIAKLLTLLTNVPSRRRTARFRCVVAFTPVSRARGKGASPVCEANEAEFATELFSGSCAGRILESTKGSKGFGYDPLFAPEGFTETFAELGEEAKNQISHRSKALEKLQQRLEQSPV